MSDLSSYLETAEDKSVEFKDLDVKFFSSRPAKFTKLMARPPRDASQEVRVTDEGFVFSLKSPAFIQRVEFEAEQTSTKPPSMKVELLPITDDPACTVKTSPHPEKSNVLIAEINAIVRGFKVAPDGFFSAFRTHKLNQITVRGYSLTDLETLEDAIFWYIDAQESFRAELKTENATLDSRKAELDTERSAWENAITKRKVELANIEAEHEKKLKTEASNAVAEMAAQKKTHDSEMAALLAAIKQKGSELTTLNDQIEETTDENSQLETRNAALSAQEQQLIKTVDECQKKERDLDQRISEKAASLDQMTKRSAQLSERLRELNSDVSMFAEDMKGVTQQGDKQITKYLWIIWSCLVLGALLAAYSVANTIKVFDTFIGNPSLKVGDLLLVKAPFAFIMASVFTFLFSFAKPFLDKIREIHAKRLRIAEISMLAREISDSALHGEQVSDGERAQFRLEVRMRFLRDYLTGVLEPKVSNQEKDKKPDNTRAVANSIISKALIPKTLGNLIPKTAPSVAPEDVN